MPLLIVEKHWRNMPLLIANRWRNPPGATVRHTLQLHPLAKNALITILSCNVILHYVVYNMNRQQPRK